MNLAEKLLTAVGIMTNAAVQKAGYDKTVVATIATVDDLETKTYTVQYGDAKHTAKGTETYKVGDQVYVIVPGESTLDWQISSLAQGILVGDTWVEIEDLPNDNLFVGQTYDAILYPNAGKNDIYIAWVLNEIKNKKRLYIRGTFTVTEALDRTNMDYGLRFTFTNLENTKDFTINDMIGDPTVGTDQQLGCLSFTDEEVDKITGLEKIEFYQEKCTVSLSDFWIYGTYSPDISEGSAYPIECKIYKTVDSTQIQVTSSLLNDISGNEDFNITFIAQVTQGSVNLLEARTSYQWQRYDFNWDNLAWEWIAIDATDKTFKVTNGNAIYPITKFKCIAIYDDANYESTEIQVKSANTDLIITPEMGKDGPRYHVTLTAEPAATEWQIKNMPEGALVKGSLGENNIIIPVTDEEENQFITIDASLITSPLEIYAKGGTEDKPQYGTITLANIGRESSNIEVLNVATYLYNLGGELTGVAPRALEAKFYDPQGEEVKEGIKWTWKFPDHDTLLIDTRDAFESGIDQGSTCTFALERYYDIDKMDNTIQVKAEYAGVIYIHTVTIGILRTGEPGTNGTDIICKIGVQHQDDAGNWGNDIDYPAYEQVTTESVELEDAINDLKFSVALENIMNGEKLVSYEQENVKKVTVKEPFWFKWSEPNISCNSWIAGQDIMCAKVEVETFEWDNEQTLWTLLDTKIYYAYLPIAKYIENKPKLKEGSGFAHVMYQPNGTNPSYYQNKFESDNADNPITTIAWWGVNGLGTDVDTIAPPSTFSLVDGTSRNIGLIITFKEGNTVELPILFRYNAYGLAQVNGWDGSSVALADGAVMAPMAGFGSKDNANQFSGVLLGEVGPTNTDGNTQSRQGIFGQYEGKETFFLNSEDGSATFGMKGKGQIKFDPAAAEGEDALITSSNYIATKVITKGEQVTEDEKVVLIEQGIPADWFDDTNYYVGKDDVAPDLAIGGQGMQINLSKPSIKWGNGTFSINESGYLEARGATFYGVTNLTNSNGEPMPEKTIMTWAAIPKDILITDTNAENYTWSTNQPSIDVQTQNLWSKTTQFYFGGGQETWYTNTTGATGEQGPQGPQGPAGSSVNVNIYKVEPAYIDLTQLEWTSTADNSDKQADFTFKLWKLEVSKNQYSVVTEINHWTYIDEDKKYSTFNKTIIKNEDNTFTITVSRKALGQSYDTPGSVDAANIFNTEITPIGISFTVVYSNPSQFATIYIQEPSYLLYFDNNFTNKSPALPETLPPQGVLPESIDVASWYHVPASTNLAKLPAKDSKGNPVYPWLSTLIRSKDGKIELSAPKLAVADSVIRDWCVDNDRTYINGGVIGAKTILAGSMKTDALRSFNYPVKDKDGNIVNPTVNDDLAGTSPYIPSDEDKDDYPNAGTFFDLANGAIYSKNFKIDSDGNAFFKGDITGASGMFSGNINVTGTDSKIGDFEIGSKNGISFIKTGELDGTDNTIYFGSDGLRVGSVLKVTSTQAKFTGVITAAADSTFGNWTLGKTEFSHTQTEGTTSVTATLAPSELSIGFLSTIESIATGTKISLTTGEDDSEAGLTFSHIAEGASVNATILWDGDKKEWKMEGINPGGLANATYDIQTSDGPKTMRIKNGIIISIT